MVLTADRKLHRLHCLQSQTLSMTDSFVNEASSYQGMMSVSFGLQHDVAASTPKRYDFSQAYFPVEASLKVSITLALSL